MRAVSFCGPRGYVGTLVEAHLAQGDADGALYALELMRTRAYVARRLLALTEGIEALFLVPHGPLTNLPFAALLAGDELLVARYRLTYLPSASLLKNILARRLPSGPPHLLAVGNPEHRTAGLERLPAADGEARAVAAVFDGGAQWQGGDAAKTRFYLEYKNFNILNRSFGERGPRGLRRSAGADGLRHATAGRRRQGAIPG